MKNCKNFNLSEELQRISQMKSYENKYNNKMICGIDEAGRGPLAGPVVAGAVVLNSNIDYLYVNDSKKLSEKKREELYDFIVKNSYAYGIGVVSNKIIDEVNILNATKLAMYKAYKNCERMLMKKYNKKIDVLLVDAVSIPNVDIINEAIIKGDQKSLSIASASIIAKVFRDRLMCNIDKHFSIYNFKKHKGYGTKEHMDMIRQYGPSIIHRKTFIKNI